MKLIDFYIIKRYLGTFLVMLLLFIPIGIMVDVAEKVDKLKEKEVPFLDILEYYIDFTLNNRRYRLKNGNKIKLKLNPNSFPVKYRKRQAELLAKKVYDHVISNNYSFEEDSRSNELALFDRLIESKLSENLSDHYRKTLRELSEKLREQVLINNIYPY